MNAPAEAPTPGYAVRLTIFFATDRLGRQVAYRFSWAAMRAIRVPLADALIWKAGDMAAVIPGHPLKP